VIVEMGDRLRAEAKGKSSRRKVTRLRDEMAVHGRKYGPTVSAMRDEGDGIVTRQCDTILRSVDGRQMMVMGLSRLLRRRPRTLRKGSSSGRGKGHGRNLTCERVGHDPKAGRRCVNWTPDSGDVCLRWGSLRLRFEA